MTKVIIESKPNAKGERLCYVEPQTGLVINSKRPTVVTNTPFVKEHISDGRFDLLASKLPDEASDEEFAEYFKESEGDKELAVESFVASFNNKDEETL